MRERAAALLAVLIALVVVLAACSSSGGGGGLPPGQGGAVVIGSANFPENQLIAEIYAQVLEKRGIKVSRDFNLGPRAVYYPLITSGQVDLVPEYNGALLNVVDPAATAASTADVNTTLASTLPPGLAILPSAAAQDRDTLTVTAETAVKYHLKSIADLAPYAAHWAFGGPPEILSTGGNYTKLKPLYGFTFGKTVPLDESGPVTVEALKHNQVQVADLFSTDKAIADNGFIVLADPKNLFTVQNVTPLIYRPAASISVVAALNDISARLTTADLAAMDAQISTTSNYAVVARAWMAKVGL